MEAARRLLEDTEQSLPEVAAASGPASVEALHRAFHRRLVTTPAEYRRRFRHHDQRREPTRATVPVP
ncbi:hypothetical protein GCM10010193_27780 [Kitasatospora atroaurantiaca]|uniref:helix-turn-helix domain-containing protein n=1 Tax=Kitasatospora atroaurantiaca TaxID=285545 RepID=UPI001FEA324D|nr:helix-turn-helix domain-containing protein [Kitasatospora atroaurantiaca]